MQYSLNIQGRSFQIAFLSGLNENLYRFPRSNGRSCYLRLSMFDELIEIIPCVYKDEEELQLEPSTTQCIFATELGDEMQFDCTPDQLVELIKFYRLLELRADLASQVFTGN